MEKIVIRSSRDLGTLIRSERKRQGYTQAQLAALCNVGLTYISHLENGKTTSELGKALHIIRMLGIDLVAVRRHA